MESSWTVDRRMEDDELSLALGEAIVQPKGNYDDRFFQPLDSETFAGKIGIGGRQGSQAELRRFLASNPDLPDRLLEHVWHFVGLGFLYPYGVAADFKVTARGREFFESRDPTAVLHGGLDAHMAALGWETNSPARFYAREAQACLLDGHHEAAIVMLGCATESLINVVANQLQNAAIGAPFRKRRVQPSASQTLAWLQESIDVHRRFIVATLTERGSSTNWLDDLLHCLSGAGEAVRITRNSYAHPTGFSANREQALGLIALFPSFASACTDAEAALR